MTPLILLDVDGVLNILGDDEAPTWDLVMSGRATCDGMSFPITWAPAVVDAFLAWLATGVEIHWLTTWGHDANTSLRQLIGLPELPVAATYDDQWEGRPEPTDAASHAAVAPAAPDPLTGTWWKYDAVQRLRAEHPDRLLIWVDDELARPTRFRRWAEAEPGVHAIGPDGDLGLTSSDLAQIAGLLGQELG